MRFHCTMGMLGLCLVVCTGCGPGAVPSGRIAVSGVVTLDDAPVTAGRVTFIPDKNTNSPAAAGTIDGTGRFAIPASDGPKPGTYTVKFILNPTSAADKFTPRGPMDNLEITQSSTTIDVVGADKLQFNLVTPTGME